MSSHYPAEEVTRFALAVLQDNSFAEIHIKLEDIEVTVPSTTDSGTYLKILSSGGEAWNKRYLLKKTMKKDALQYWPLGEPETEVWTVKLHQMQLEVSSCSGTRQVSDLLWDTDTTSTKTYQRNLASEPFELQMDVELLKKTFELNFLYNVVQDPAHFPKNVKISPQTSTMPKLKPRCTPKEFHEQLEKYLDRLQSGLPKETLYLDGRYTLDVKSDNVKLILTNQVVNVLLVVMANNINFDDGMEETLKNAYQISTDGVPVLTRIAFKKFLSSIPDLKEPKTELILLELVHPRIVCDKLSNFQTLIDLQATECSGQFGTGIPLSSQHKRFITQTEYNEILDNSSDEDMMVAAGTDGRLPNQKPSSLVYLTGKMHFHKDGRKEVELRFSKAQLRLFSFLSRILGELLILDPVPLPEGFAEAPPGVFSLLVKIPKAEVCLTSGQDSCLVMAADLNYHMQSDPKLSQQIVSLSNAEVFDCLENIYISKGIEAVKKRNITRPFDFNFILREDLLHNVLDLTISSASILAKLTAFNLQVLQSIYTYQTFAEELVSQRSVYFVETPERKQTLTLLARKAGKTVSPSGNHPDSLQTSTDDIMLLVHKQRMKINLNIDGVSLDRKSVV